MFQATKLLSGLIPAKDEKDSQVKLEHYEHLYIFALMWSIGAFLEVDDRIKMEQWLRTSPDINLDLPDIPEESESTMFDYLVAADGQSYSYFIFLFTYIKMVVAGPKKK